MITVHAPVAEKKAVEEGWAVKRTLIGSNEFFIVGPAADPAKISEAGSAKDAFRRIALAKAKFFSRGDNSGTRKKEMDIRQMTGIDPAGDWHVVTKDFMTATLTRANDESGGEGQRAAIGRALLASPFLLLMDEPLASLDGTRKVGLLPFIGRLSREFAVPILYVSHALEELRGLADAMVVLDSGRVVAAGPTRDLVARPDWQCLVGSGNGSNGGQGIEGEARNPKQIPMTRIRNRSSAESTLRPSRGPTGRSLCFEFQTVGF